MKLLKFKQARLRNHNRGGFWMALLIQIVIFVAVELLRPKEKLENAKPSGLGDFTFPTATEGRVVPLLWGTVRVDGPNVVWYDDLDQVAIIEKIKTGLFSSQKVVIGHSYRLGMQFAIARGPVDALTGLWIGDDQVWTGSVAHGGTFTLDDDELFGGDEDGDGGFEGTFEFFEGNSTQSASSYLSTFQTQGGDTPAYRGTCYIAPSSENWYVGNSTTIKPWKFELKRTPNGLALIDGKEEVNGADANPANVIYEIMTNSEWGLGYSASDIDTTNFTTAATTLYDEGFGFSLLLTSPREASEVIRQIEEQVDCVVRYNHASAKWEIKLIRADYTPGTMPEVTVDNMVELVNYSRGSWEGTSNIVRVQFNDRTDEYKQTYATAQDSANVRIQDVDLSVTKNYPGVMDRTQANNLAWRDLRVLSYPLAKASVVVDRTFWDALPGDVVEFTHAYLDIDTLPMRIMSMDFGELENNRIRMELVQDVFYTATPSFSDPSSTKWTTPSDSISAYASDEQVAFEAPRAIVRRDPKDGSLVNKIMAAARQSGNEITFDIRERHHPTTPSGAYTTAGTVVQFVKIGELNAALTMKSAYPLTALTVTSSPDTQAALLGSFAIPADADELGTSLMNLVMVDDEFMLVTGASANGADVDIDDVYRGVLDSVQADHASGAEVFVLMAGAGVTDNAIPETDAVHVELIPVGFSNELAEGVGTRIDFTMDKRLRRPYPPSMLTLNTVDWDTTAVNMESGGSGPEDYSIDSVIRRRDYRLADNLNEITGLTEDSGTTFADFPAANSTDHDLEVRHDPTGTNDLILNTTISGTTHALLRIDVLQALGGAVPTGDIEWTWTASHTDGGETLTSRQDLVHAAAISSALTGLHEFGLLGITDQGAEYTAASTATHTFTLSTAFTTSNVEYDVDTGGGYPGTWATLIAGGATSNGVALNSGDKIKIRVSSGDSGFLKQITMDVASTDLAFAILEP